MNISNLRLRSSTDFVNAYCFSKSKFDEKNLVHVHHPIIRFGRGVIYPTRTVTLLVRVEEKDVSQTLFINFLVVGDLTTYDVIIGWPTLNQVKAVIVTLLMFMKFQCDDRQVETLYGDQQATIDCYLTTLKPSSWKVGEKDETKAACEGKIAEIVKTRQPCWEGPLRILRRRSLPPSRRTFETVSSKKIKYRMRKWWPNSSWIFFH